MFLISYFKVIGWAVVAVLVW